MRSWGVWGFHFFSSTISFFHSHTKTNVCGKVASINLSLSENTWLIWQLTWSYPGFWPTFSYSYILVLHWSKFQSHVHPSSLENREFKTRRRRRRRRRPRKCCLKSEFACLQSLSRLRELIYSYSSLERERNFSCRLFTSSRKTWN